MADQKLSLPCAPAKTEMPNKSGSAKRAGTVLQGFDRGPAHGTEIRGLEQNPATKSRWALVE